MTGIPVVWGRGHTGHAPYVEVQGGRRLPGFDRVERIERILAELERLPGVQLCEPATHGLDPVLRVHSEELVAFLEECSSRAGPGEDGLLFADTFLNEQLREDLGPPERSGFVARFGRHCFDTIAGIGPDTFAAARESVDCALTAVDLLEAGNDLTVALTRPPGHHASRDLFGGGTFLNNAAIAAQSLRDRGHERVAMLDVDAHHGNGSQSIFYRRSDVLFVSVHVDPVDHYPFLLGFEDERGAGEGEGFNINVLLPPASGAAAYMAALRTGLERIVEFEPDALVVSLGLDPHGADPVEALALATEDFRAMGAAVGELGEPTVIVLEGGYDMATIGRNMAEWLAGFQGRAGH